MKLQELKALVSQGEGQLVEFKHKASFPDKIMKEVVAFANSKGGHLLIGVDDNGTIGGLKFAEEEQYVVDKAIKKHCRPIVQYQKRIIKLSEKRSVLAYRIYESKSKPHFWVEDPTKKGWAYVRVDDKSVKASAEYVKVLRGRKKDNGTILVFGELEKKLMELIEQKERITLQDITNDLKIPKWKASNLLVKLVNANILEMDVQEKHDFYAMKEYKDITY